VPVAFDSAIVVGLVGEIFGRYELLRKIATGGMGQVYLARQKGPVGFEKLMVVKRILPHLAEEDQFIEMFFDEARIAAHLNHPNIAQIFDLGDVDGTFYIAMEYVNGESLKQVMNRVRSIRSQIPLGLKVRIAADAAAGLHSAHQARNPAGKLLDFIHRDVSPQNILVGFNGFVKLIDFGVAKAATKVSNTVTGAIKGKYAYMSPEQARGGDLDHRSDIFGLGTILYEMLTEQRLFKRENENATLKAVISAKPAAPSTMGIAMPPAIDAICLKALEKKPDDRYQSAEDFQLALEEFIRAERLQATSTYLASFMRKLYDQEQGEEDESTLIEDDPSDKRSNKKSTSKG
jgi:serine/threonine-protein kinase